MMFRFLYFFFFFFFLLALVLLSDVTTAEKTKVVCDDDGGGSCENPEDCVDLHSTCADWAYDGECLLNPEYMVAACPYSCGFCVNEPYRKQEGLDDHTIKRIQIYGTLDLGVSQLYTNNNNKKQEDATKLVIQQMDMYSKTVLPDLIMMMQQQQPLSLLDCKNMHPNCAFWASQGLCTLSVIPMLEQCSLACQSCSFVEQFQRCYNNNNNNKNPSTTTSTTTTKAIWNIEELFSKTIQDNYNRLFKKEHSLEILSQPNKKGTMDAKNNGGGGDEKNNDDDPWLIHIPKFVTDKEVKALIHLANSNGWEEKDEKEGPKSSLCLLWPSSSSNTDDNDNTIKKDCLKTSKVLKSVLERISKLVDIPLEHFEDVEMIHYANNNIGDSMTVHHDYMIHDVWKPAGPRILTALLVLSDVAKGGATGFPELDWLTVPAHKGQLLLWSNVMTTTTTTNNQQQQLIMEPKVAHEGLPVLEGTKYVFHIWIHSDNWKQAQEQNCT